MLHSSLLSVNPVDGAKTFMHLDDVTKQVFFETSMDVEAILEENLRERNLTEAHTPYGGGMRVARIPNFIMSMLRRTNRDPDRNSLAFYRWLEDHPYFKVRNGNMRGLVKGD